ncbi:MAG: hypothetical protein GY795_36985, partial [Desulfobacterales bacterium]|nr:hypothetical protein [Desulfobacterales bacterium]
LSAIITPEIQNLDAGVTTSVELDLLDYYSDTDIIGALSANGGKLPMYYQDDANIGQGSGLAPDVIKQILQAPCYMWDLAGILLSFLLQIAEMCFLMILI